MDKVEQSYKIYVDGTFYNGMYGGSYVIYDGKDIIYQDCGIGTNEPELLAMRNISGEMTAAMRATNWLHHNNKKGIIYHDYNGLAFWAKGEWKRNNKYTQMYFEYMFPFYKQGIIDFVWVKGHKGVEGNEIADRLAKQAVMFNQTWKF